MGVDMIQTPVAVEIDRLLIDITIRGMRRGYREVAEGAGANRIASSRNELAGSARRGDIERRVHMPLPHKNKRSPRPSPLKSTMFWRV